MTAAAPRLMALHGRWVTWARAENALLMDEPLADLVDALFHPDEDGLRDLVQLATGALYRGTHAGLQEPLMRCLLWLGASIASPDAPEAGDAELHRLDTELSALHALMLEAGAPTFLERSAAPTPPETTSPATEEHPTSGDAPPPRRATRADTDPIVLTRSLAHDLVCRHGWPAGRALLASHELRRALRPGTERDAREAIFAGEWPDTPLCDDPQAAPLVPTLRAVMAAFEGRTAEELAGQYRAAALALALPAWLDILAAHGLPEADHRRALDKYTTLLTGHDAWTMVWESFYDPTVLEHLNNGWCAFAAASGQHGS